MFKPFGEYHGHDDAFLTLSASIGMIMNCVARMVGGIILDKIRFKHYFGLVLFSSVILSYTFSYVADYPIAFMIYLALSYYIAGSVFVSTPVFYGKVFGPEIGS